MRRFFAGLFTLGAIAALIACFSLLTGIGGDVANREEMQQIENSVRQAAVACYAAEGYYPASLEALAENYSLRYNSEDYIVRYDFFADNILPDIEVFSRR